CRVCASEDVRAAANEQGFVMAAQAHPAKRIYPGPGDPIRIVPLSLPDALLRPAGQPPVAAAAPQLTYRGGPLIAAVEVFTIFWGPAWQSAPLAPTASQINAFFDFH